MSDHRVAPLLRGQPIAPELVPQAFLFDPVTADQMQEWLGQARLLATMLGFTATGAQPAADAWYVDDRLSRAYGTAVPTASLTNPAVFVRRGDRALVEIDGTWTSAVKVTAGSSWDDHRRRELGAFGRDPRLIGDERDSSGRRFLTFEQCALRLDEQAIVGFPLSGKRAAKELVMSLRTAGQDYLAHHSEFLKRSGLGEKTGVAREHRHLSEALRLMLQHDLFDVSNSSSGEFLSRRMLQIEQAVRRNVKAPDFEGLDSFLDTATDEVGGAVVPEFAAWVGDRQKAEATVLKAGRQWREERKTETDKQKGRKEDK